MHALGSIPEYPSAFLLFPESKSVTNFAQESDKV